MAISYQYLGIIYQSLGDFDKALQFFNLQSDLFIELYEANYKSENLKNGLAISYLKLGDIYQLLGDFNKALQFFNLYNQYSKELYEVNPKREELKRSLAISYEKLGSIYQSLGDFDKALQFFNLRNQYSKELYEANPKSLDMYSGLGISYYKLGGISQQLNKKKEAIEYFTKAVIIFNNIYKQTKIEQYNSWANAVQEEINKLSVTNTDKINEQKEQIKLLEKEEQTAEVKTYLSYAYGNLSWYYLFEKEFAEAEASARKALKYDASQTWVNTNLAHALLFQGKYKDAEKIYKEMKDKVYEQDPSKTYKDIFLSDLTELETAGVTHKDVQKIRDLLK